MKKQNSKHQVVMPQENHLTSSLSNTENAVKIQHNTWASENNNHTYRQNSDFKNTVVMHRQAADH